MNRRSFLGDMLKLGIGAMILPGAGRHWVRRNNIYMGVDLGVDMGYSGQILVMRGDRLVWIKPFPEADIVNPINQMLSMVSENPEYRNHTVHYYNPGCWAPDIDPTDVQRIVTAGRQCGKTLRV